jgi:hypothetical protein
MPARLSLKGVLATALACVAAAAVAYAAERGGEGETARSTPDPRPARPDRQSVSMTGEALGRPVSLPALARPAVRAVHAIEEPPPPDAQATPAPPPRRQRALVTKSTPPAPLPPATDPSPVPTPPASPPPAPPRRTTTPPTTNEGLEFDDSG